MSSSVLENALIERLAGIFSRSPLQLNALQESDAELIQVPGTDLILAVETDAIVEEIEEELYADPYLAGWMAVLVNASDLAAVGAVPLGIVLNETLPRQAEEAFLDRLQRGIRDASDRCGLPVLGGDTNFAEKLQVAAFAIGLIPDGKPLMRTGARPGDVLFLAGPAGLGNAFAFLQLSAGKEGSNGIEYLPQPRLHEGQSLRAVASACIDTSDGLIPALDQLSEVNGIGFRFEIEPGEFLHPAATHVAEQAGLPPWIMLAGPHGEFELLFSVPAERVDAFLAAVHAELAWQPIRLGTVIPEEGLELPIDGSVTRFDTTRIRNLFTECEGDVQRYVHELLRVHEQTRIVQGVSRNCRSSCCSRTWVRSGPTTPAHRLPRCLEHWSPD